MKDVFFACKPMMYSGIADRNQKIVGFFHVNQKRLSG